jgi:disulfide oxidoreductase YuzD
VDRNEKQKQLLDASAQAFNSVVVIEKLRNRILATRDMTGVSKKPRHIFNDEVIQKIYDALYDHLTPGYFWEAFIFMLCDDMDRFNFATTSSVGYVSEIDRSNVLKRLKPIKSTCYEAISLRDHTLHMVETFLTSSSAIATSAQFTTLCASILHDFGKSRDLVFDIDPSLVEEKYDHAEFGYQYVIYLKRKIAKQFEEKIKNDQYFEYQLSLIDIIADGVKYHHHNTRQFGDTPYRVGFIDQKTRESEWYAYLDSKS